MSAHYSKYLLNTYAGTPYFRANIPDRFPINLLLQRARAHRRLPPNVKQLASLARQWAALHSPEDEERENDPNGAVADGWYDSGNHELDPATGERLTDAEIDEEWDALNMPPLPPAPADIPVPTGGFADPDEWEPPEPPREARRLPSKEQLLSDIASRGRKATAAVYGVDESDLPTED